ncbi:hypothetical protein CRUP_037287 [Coryphaenoides rupestris]|nr:hypothetical protein CRUP_037287 [Coryphaenoides rupestris]
MLLYGRQQRCSRESWFPKNNDLRKQWEVALRREGFTDSQLPKLCSEHFRQEDFDRTASGNQDNPDVKEVSREPVSGLFPACPRD